MAATRTWIKNPLAIFTANSLDATGGLVIEHGVIVELLKAGQQPSLPCEQTFDAREHCGAARADQHPPSLLPNPHPRLGPGGQPTTISLAENPLPGMGTPDPGEASPGQ